MKLYFKEKDPNKVISDLTAALGGRKLGSLLEFSLNGKDVTVTIKKLGTSTLEFTHNPSRSDGLEWVLSQEKIAFAHKAFKDDMLSKLTTIIENIGGVVT